MPKQIQTGHVTQSLQRAFGFKGDYRPMLDEVIVPVYVVADPTPAAVQRLCAATANQGLVVADAYIQLFNPPGSGVLANVTSVVASADVKAELRVAFFNSPGEAAGTTFFRDRRNQGSPSCEIRVDDTEASSVGDLVAVLQVDGAFSQISAWRTDASDPRQPLAVLSPGDGLILQGDFGTASGAIIRGNFRWLEVPIWDIRPESGLP